MMEQRLPKKDHGTLWERDELTVRFLLEEGKLNMCLRLLRDFKVLMWNKVESAAVVQKAAGQLNCTHDAVMARLQLYEQSMGLLLKCSFQSVESLQTCDIPLLVSYCGDVITHFLERTELEPDANMERSQECLVLYYLHSLAVALEDVGDDRTMQYFEEHRILPLVISQMSKGMEVFKSEVLRAGVEFLSMVFDTEMFSTHKERVIDQESSAALVALKGKLLPELATDLQQRMKVQPFIDTATAYERRMG
mmetsp:Transcript_5546/g.18699  ORF Transcript_5546/g.18699 Transcript_5546/m.18699 type:complete len:250 (+) Transcript_5546:200-949(+)